MTALTVYNVVDAGTAPTFVAAAAGQTIDVGTGHNTFLVVKNADATPHNVTLAAHGTTDYGDALPDHVVAAPNGGEVWIPIRKSYDPGDGTSAAAITYAATTSMTVAAVRVS